MIKKYGMAISALVLSGILAPIVIAAPGGIKPDDSSLKYEYVESVAPAPGLSSSWAKVAADNTIVIGKARVKYSYTTKTFTQANCPDGFTLIGPDENGNKIIVSKRAYAIPAVLSGTLVTLTSKSTGLQTYATPKYELVKPIVKFDAMITDKTDAAKWVWKATTYEKKAFITTKQWTDTDTPGEDDFAVFPANGQLIVADAEFARIDIPICEKTIEGGDTGGTTGGIGGASSMSSAMSISSQSSVEPVLCETTEMCDPDFASSSSAMSSYSMPAMSSASAMSSYAMSGMSSFGFSSSSFSF